MKGYVVCIFRDVLEIHYCDPISMETVRCITFKDIDELEKFINNCQ